jgi:hypothetical protein
MDGWDWGRIINREWTPMDANEEGGLGWMGWMGLGKNHQPRMDANEEGGLGWMVDF